MSQRPNDEPLQTTKNTIDNYSIQTVFIIHKKKCFNRNNSNKTHKNSKKEKEKRKGKNNLQLLLLISSILCSP